MKFKVLREETVCPFLSFSIGKAALWGARKTSWASRGTVGVLAYYVSDIHQTLAVMWSVPYDYNWYENWWNVKLYSGDRKASYDIWYDMYYYANPFKGNHHWYRRDLGGSCEFSGSMTGSSAAILEIHVSRKWSAGIVRKLSVLAYPLTVFRTLRVTSCIVS